MKSRITLLLSIVLVANLAVFVRLFFWVVVRGEDLSKQAQMQQQSNESLIGKRGNILYNDGTWMAGINKMWSMAVIRSRLNKNEDQLIGEVSPILFPTESDDKKYFENKEKQLFANKSLEWIPVQNRVSETAKNEIDSLGIKGIEFVPTDVRYYPEASATAHLLGFVGKDENGADKGYFGLEGYYDTTLRGKEGFSQREADVRGMPIAGGNAREISASDGVDLVTSIDKGMQYLVEKAITLGITKYGAKSGSVIIANPHDGTIMAMASSPSYDPFNYFDFSNDLFRNPIISEVFEPGSIFKAIVMASALDAKVVEPDTKCNICSGPYSVGGYTIETWNNKYYSESSMTDVITHSDNVGMVYVGKQLGSDRLYDYLDKFGFGKSTGIDLQGEVSSTLRKRGSWTDLDLATTTFGQGIAVTQIQMLRAVSVIANKGLIVRPHIVTKLLGSGLDYQISSSDTQRVISEDAANKITQMMVSAVENGEAKWAKPKGFVIAGKTGTAQIPVAGHYDPQNTTASFIGFAPAKDPKFVMLVTLNSPQSSQWASETAAPLWFGIAKDLFVKLGIQPES